MIDGLRRAAEIALAHAAKCRETLRTKRSGRRDELRVMLANLAAVAQARGAEALARTFEAEAEQEDTPPHGTVICPNCAARDLVDDDM